MKRTFTILIGILLFVAGIAVGAYYAANGLPNLTPTAIAEEDSKSNLPKLSPVKARPRDAYFPNSEDLGANEMRVIACGTGMPTARPSQAAACFLVELGNGDKFIFDVGTGSAERIAALQIPYNYLDKVFLGHLHTDHFGDLASLFVGGALSGRQKPLRVWGPSGKKSEYGTKYAVEHLRQMVNWDLAGRKGLVDERGYKFEIHEFDYKGVNQIVYQENGVTIRSWPAIHSLDGPVSFGLEWNDLKFVFSSDTYPNKWFVEFAKNADLVIHECFIAVPSLIEKFKFPPQTALSVGTQIHTPPEAFGKVMSMVKPRMAVAYHFFKDFDTTAAINDRIRSTYDGPLSLAQDFMVWNVTKEKIRVRMAVVNEEVWPPPATERPLPPDPSRRIPFSDLITGGKLDVKDVLQPIYDEVNKKFGLNEQPGKGE
ncbi:guanitoxin biosynthesis MBL fold metallo-hydrolase GntH [Thermodesulfobacteriota bacterium]